MLNSGYMVYNTVNDITKFLLILPQTEPQRIAVFYTYI